MTDKETMRRAVGVLRPDIDDAEFEVMWLLFVAGRKA